MPPIPFRHKCHAAFLIMSWLNFNGIVKQLPESAVFALVTAVIQTRKSLGFTDNTFLAVVNNTKLTLHIMEQKSHVCIPLPEMLGKYRQHVMNRLDFAVENTAVKLAETNKAGVLVRLVSGTL